MLVSDGAGITKNCPKFPVPVVAHFVSPVNKFPGWIIFESSWQVNCIGQDLQYNYNVLTSLKTFEDLRFVTKMVNSKKLHNQSFDTGQIKECNFIDSEPNKTRNSVGTVSTIKFSQRTSF